MNFKFILFALLLVIFTTLKTVAQVETDRVVEQIIESIAENVGEDFDYSELTERLNNYRKNPLDVNQLSQDQLKELVFLSPLQISAFLSYRDENGKFIDLLELQSIDGFDLETIRKLLYFVRLNQQNPLKGFSFKDAFANGNNELLIRYGQNIEQQNGFTIPDTSTQSRYLGTPQRYLTRYRFSYGQHISFALNMEKDAGEGFFNAGQKKGFDFYSASLYVKDLGKISKLVIGDYSLQFGQGLTLWSGLSFGKGAAITTIPKQAIGLKPYTSTNEVLFFRGLASTIKLNSISVTPFVSYRKLDASLKISAVSEENEAGALGQSGLHRTNTEVINENAVSQLVFGLNAQYNKRNLTIGTVAYQSQFDHAFQRGKYLYNQYDFAAKSLVNTGAYYNYSFKNLYLYGEAAHSIHSGFAFLNGAIASLSPQVALVMLYRDYQKNYQSFFNQGLAESSTAVNEKGFYTGVIITPTSKYELSSYVDFFKFPSFKFGVDAPSNGYELFSQLTYSPTKKIKASLRYRYKNKQENDDIDNAVNFLETVAKQSYRAELSYKISNNFQLRNRVEVSNYKKESTPAEIGYLLYQDVIYNPLTSKLSGNIRFAIFDTPTFNSRIYAYENDVLYGYSIPGFQNQGIRFYLNTRYTFYRGMDLWLKYAVTNYTNLNQVGSGLDLINGNTKSDVKVQLRFQF